MLKQGDFSSTYAVMLSSNRLVHSINVTFDDADYTHAQAIDPDSLQPVVVPVRAPSGAAAEKAYSEGVEAPAAPE